MASTPASAPSAPFSVGGVLVDPARRVLSDGGSETTVEPKVMAVLLALARQPGMVVTRQELLDDIWAREFAGDESLTRAISLLRKALGGKQVIETVPKRGYRLQAEVREDAGYPRGGDSAQPAASPPHGVSPTPEAPEQQMSLAQREAVQAPPPAPGAPPAPRNFIEELKRRSVIREGIAYIVAAVLVIEAVDIVSAAFNGPAWILQGVIALAALGFIPAMLLAWAYEVTPGGFKRDGAALDAGRATRKRRLTLATLAMLAALAGLYFVPLEPPIDSPPGPAPLDGPPTVAVLPLAAGEASEEAQLIAAGVMDDLLTRLSKIPSLRVISRRAALGYRDTTKTAREIGAELYANAVLTGSVQLEGDRLRLRAQLVDTGSEAQLWAESFDRRLDPASLFAIQAEVARAIAQALSAELTDEDQRGLDDLPTENMAAYRAFHQAMGRYDEVLRLTGRGAGDDSLTESYIAYLEQAVSEDPRFARAWAQLVYASTWINQNGRRPELAARAEEGLRVLADIAPESGEYRMAQAAYLYYTVRDYDRALKAVTEAIARQPGDVRFHELKYFIARRSHNPSLMIEATRDALTLDPNNPLLIERLSRELGDLREGLALLNRVPRGQNYRVDFARSSIRLALEKEPQAHLLRVQALASLHPERAAPHHLWYAQMMASDFSGALQTIDAIEAKGRGHTLFPLSAAQVHGLYSYYYANQPEALKITLASAERTMAEAPPPGSLFHQSELMLARALLTALGGDREETLLQLVAWERGVIEHGLLWAGGSNRPHACFILGIALQAEEVVACVRRAIEEHSWARNPELVRHWPGFAFLKGYPAYEALLDEFGS